MFRRGGVVLSVIALCSLACACASRPARKPHDPALIEALGRAALELPHIGGRYVGISNSPSTHYILAQQALKYGRTEDFLRLCDGWPSQAALGWMCLVQTDPALAAAVIHQRLDSDERIETFISCLISETSEGVFAAQLLFDPEFGGVFFGEGGEALMSPRQRRVLAVRLLGSDRHHELHDDVRAGAEQAFATKADTDPRILLERTWPIHPLLIIKAVGRLEPTERTRQLLGGWLADASLEPEWRLAAASGLTLDPSDAAGHMLRHNYDLLDEIGGFMSDVLIEDWEITRRARQADAQIDWPDDDGQLFASDDKQAEYAGAAAPLIESELLGHPVLVDRLLLLCRRGDEKLLDALEPFIKAMAKEAGYRDEWDTHHVAAWQLQERLALHPGLLPESEWHDTLESLSYDTGVYWMYSWSALGKGSLFSDDRTEP